MNSPFAAPAAATGIEWAELNGKLLVIEPKTVEEGVQTVHGLANPVKADVHVLEAPGGEYIDTLIFPKVLCAQTGSRIGQKVLGRLGQGQAKPGQSAPWMIQDPTEQDIAVGTAWLNSRQQSQFAAAAPTGAPTTQQTAPQAAAPAGAPPF